MPLNTLVGSWKGSVGLTTTGQILDAGRWCSTQDAFLNSYGNGSTVGVLVFIDTNSAFETWDGNMLNATVTFTVDGRAVGLVVGGGASGVDQGANLCSTVLAIPCEEELYPTLTLHSSNTSVLCQFCSADIIAKEKKELGGGQLKDTDIVYALDGSVLFEDE
jgi:hypothetical protein